MFPYFSFLPTYKSKLGNPLYDNISPFQTLGPTWALHPRSSLFPYSVTYSDSNYVLEPSGTNLWYFLALIFSFIITNKHKIQ
jgi:hypothetical protein